MPNFDNFGFFNAFDAFAWLAVIRDGVAELFAWIQTKYLEEPAVILGIALALAVPAIATAGAVVRRISQTSGHPEVVEIPTVRTRPISVWRQTAYLELPDNSRYPIEQDIVRIGREADNDLRLAHPTVHRYHVVLERSPDVEFIVSYVGDPDHAGLIINGNAVQRQRLRGGEVLEIGSIKLRFSVSPA
ncbi:MAG: FHA domain-containing protein [Hyphomicrobiaceae bacterium]